MVIHMIGAVKKLIKLLHNLSFYVYHTIKKGLTFFVVHMPQA